MPFLEQLWPQTLAMTPYLAVGIVLLVPFVLLEQLRPVHRRPKFRDYGLNVLISLSTAYLALPAGLAAGLWSEQLRRLLPWSVLPFSYDRFASIPGVGAMAQIAAMIIVPLVVHDFWFYWAHRLEHRVPLLWEFHKIHHSDELMNCSTWARDHFMQAAFRSFVPAFTIGLIFDVSAIQAGQAALLSGLFISCLSMFYHSAARVRLSWLDRVLVTPQVHRIHHSTDPAHFNRNFADALPIFDICFGTYRRPQRDEYPATGLGPEFPAPRSLVRAQFGPLVAAGRLLCRDRSQRRSVA